MIKYFLIMGMLFLLPNLASAENFVKTDRYTRVKLAPSKVQLSPLDAVVDIKFPAHVITIEQSIYYLLDDSGFEFIDDEYRSKALSLMITNRLSSVHRDLTPMSLKDALSVVVGQHFRLIHDPLRRKVSFVLKPEYEGLIDE